MDYKMFIMHLLSKINDEYSLRRIYKLVEYLYLRPRQ